MRYTVTRRGIDQIIGWMYAHYTDEEWDLMVRPEDVIAAVYLWIDAAEDAADGEIMLPADGSVTGQAAYLRPERVARVVEA